MAKKSFGGLKPCANQKTIHTGNGLLFADVSDTPKISPHTYGTDPFELRIPTNAAEVYIRTSTKCKVSNDDTFNGYINVEGGHPFAVADLEVLHLDPDTAGELEFYFVTV